MIFFCDYQYKLKLITYQLIRIINYFFSSLWQVCLWQQTQNFFNSNRVGVLRRFLRVVYREIPADLSPAPLEVQIVHAKPIVTLASLLLVIKLIAS